MSRTIAIVHAPGVNQAQLNILVEKLRDFINQIDFNGTEIQVNPDPPFRSEKFGIRDEIITLIVGWGWWMNEIPLIDMNNSENDDIPSTLIIGWGLSKKPCWTKWTYEIKTSKVIRLFIAIDLYERYGANGRILMMPDVKTGSYWRHKSWQTRCKLFLNGCYVSYVAPYGMKRIPKDVYDNDLTVSIRYILVPGLQQEIEIVRLIFHLFVNHSYTMTEISNLLNAQGIMAPNRSKIWNGKKIRSLMTSAIYIGSNQYGACIKHNVFPALIDRSTFCAAMAKIHGKGAFAPFTT
jgi:hypothetical protein